MSFISCSVNTLIVVMGPNIDFTHFTQLGGGKKIRQHSIELRGVGVRAFGNMWETTIVLPTLPLQELRKTINA